MKYEPEDFPISSLPDRQRILDNFDKALSLPDYAKKYKYSKGHVRVLCRGRRLDCIKLVGRWWILDAKPILYNKLLS
jgi:hypothetical protein